MTTPAPTPTPKATFRTSTATNAAVRSAIAQATVSLGGDRPSADAVIGAALQLVGNHWDEFLSLLPADAGQQPA